MTRPAAPTSHDTTLMTTNAGAPLRRRMMVSALLAVAVIGAWPTAAGAQAEWRDQIARQLAGSGFVAGFRDQGYAPLHDTRYDLLEDGATSTVSLELEGGRTYQFVAKCDADCTDLDVRVLDPHGAVVDADVEPDDHPLASASPATGGTYRIEITMADCDAMHCGWGLVVLATPARAAASIRPVAGAEPTWREQIRRQLETSGIVGSLKGEGWAESHDTFYDLVATGSSETVTIDLAGGRTYRFVGKCDNDCSDLDFQLYDAAGALVDSDLQADDVPLITVAPPRTATYRLRVTMASCSVALCGWGVTVLAR